MTTPDPITPERVALTEGEARIAPPDGCGHPQCEGTVYFDPDLAARDPEQIALTDAEKVAMAKAVLIWRQNALTGNPLIEAVERILSDRLCEAKADAWDTEWGLQLTHPEGNVHVEHKFPTRMRAVKVMDPSKHRLVWRHVGEWTEETP